MLHLGFFPTSALEGGRVLNSGIKPELGERVRRGREREPATSEVREGKIRE